MQLDDIALKLVDSIGGTEDVREAVRNVDDGPILGPCRWRRTRRRRLIEDRRPRWPRETRLVRESCCQDCELEADEAILRGVWVLGLESYNGRRYKPEACQAALGLYEALVNCDHPAGNPNASRSMRDRFGRLVNPRFVEGKGIVADLHFNPKHPDAAMVRWFADNDPSALGLSHNAVGQGRNVDGIFVIDRIVSVRSVDLVADPATTRGLY
jgi:hypothetical protein